SRVQRVVRARLRARGPGRRARRGGARTRFRFPAQVPGVFPPRGRRRRRGNDPGAARRGHRAGRARRGRQVLHAASGRLRHLRRDGAPAHRLPRGHLRQAPMSGLTGELRRETLFEAAFWLALLAAYFLLPGYRVLGSQILIVSLFALSLDLVLGYAGILTLGHAAFFGLGAYTAGLLAVHGWGEPLTGLLAGAVVAAIVGFVTSFLVVRGEDLTRLMVTLGLGFLLYEAANKAAFVTGGVDGLSGVTMWKLLGVFPFDLGGKVAYVYSLAVLFLLF